MKLNEPTRFRFLEARAEGREWDIACISPGVSKNANKFYYAPDVLKKAVPLFENAKIFSFAFPNRLHDHMSIEDEDKAPAGFAYNIVGWIDNVRYGKFMRDGKEDEGIIARFHVADNAKWLRDLLLDAFRHDKKSLLEFSINAEGEAVTASVNNQDVRKVTRITAVKGVDVVTHGAAGGSVLKLVASQAPSSIQPAIDKVAYMLKDAKEALKLANAKDKILIAAINKIQGTTGLYKRPTKEYDEKARRKLSVALSDCSYAIGTLKSVIKKVQPKLQDLRNKAMDLDWSILRADDYYRKVRSIGGNRLDKQMREYLRMVDQIPELEKKLKNESDPLSRKGYQTKIALFKGYIAELKPTHEAYTKLYKTVIGDSAMTAVQRILPTHLYEDIRTIRVKLYSDLSDVRKSLLKLFNTYSERVDDKSKIISRLKHSKTLIAKAAPEKRDALRRAREKIEKAIQEKLNTARRHRNSTEDKRKELSSYIEHFESAFSRPINEIDARHKRNVELRRVLYRTYSQRIYAINPRTERPAIPLPPEPEWKKYFGLWPALLRGEEAFTSDVRRRFEKKIAALDMSILNYKNSLAEAKRIFGIGSRMAEMPIMLKRLRANVRIYDAQILKLETLFSKTLKEGLKMSKALVAKAKITDKARVQANRNRGQIPLRDKAEKAAKKSKKLRSILQNAKGRRNFVIDLVKHELRNRSFAEADRVYDKSLAGLKTVASNLRSELSGVTDPAKIASITEKWKEIKTGFQVEVWNYERTLANAKARGDLPFGFARFGDIAPAISKLHTEWSDSADDWEAADKALASYIKESIDQFIKEEGPMNPLLILQTIREGFSPSWLEGFEVDGIDEAKAEDLLLQICEANSARATLELSEADDGSQTFQEVARGVATLQTILKLLAEKKYDEAMKKIKAWISGYPKPGKEGSAYAYPSQGKESVTDQPADNDDPDIDIDPEVDALIAAALGNDDPAVALPESNTGGNTVNEVDILRTEIALGKALESSELPEPSRRRIEEAFTGRVATASEIRESIGAEKDYIATLIGDADPAARGASKGASLQIGAEERDKFNSAMFGMLNGEDHDNVPQFSSLHESYREITGFAGQPKEYADRIMHAMRFSLPGMPGHEKEFKQHHKRLKESRSVMPLTMKESLQTTDWAEVFGDSVRRKMMMDYMESDYPDWRLVVSEISNLKDFRTERRIRVGGFGDLSQVSQLGTYTELTAPTDEEVNFAAQKYGNLFTISWETLVNDDLGEIRRLPTALGRSAARTLSKFVFNTNLSDNPAMDYDSELLISAAHSNNQTAALTAATLLIAVRQMRKQTEQDSSERLALRAKYLIVPPDLEETAWELCYSNVKVETGNDATVPNFFKARHKLEMILNDWQTDTDDWFIMANPKQNPTIEIGFLGGKQEPEVFVQNQPNVGAVMTADKLTYKIRFIFGGDALDHRMFAGSIV